MYMLYAVVWKAKAEWSDQNIKEKGAKKEKHRVKE